MKWRKVFIVLGVVIFTGIVVAVLFSMRVRNFEAYMDQIKINELDIASINNGIYSGISDSGVIKVSVEVEIQNNKIKDIRLLEHRNGKGEAAEAIIGDIIREQKIKVDTISGATLSSIVIQDAVQKALK